MLLKLDHHHLVSFSMMVALGMVFAVLMSIVKCHQINEKADNDFILQNLPHSNQFYLDRFLVRKNSTTRLKWELMGVDKIASINSNANKTNFKIQLSGRKSSLLEIKVEKFNQGVLHFRLEWHQAGPDLSREICFYYNTPHSNETWYSTYTEHIQSWPMDGQKQVQRGTPFLIGAKQIDSIVEHIFASSNGFIVRPDHYQPLFFRRDSNHGHPLLCFAVDATRPPYNHHQYEESRNILKIDIFSGQNMRQVYEQVKQSGYIDRPHSIPDRRMFELPVWSTWAIYKKDITQSKVLDYARQISQHGFPNSQVEIDDNWEAHYGDFKFDSKKFPDPKKMIDQLHRQGYRVTLWVYPFVNKNSVSFQEAKPYFLKQAHNSSEFRLAKWWDGEGGMIDFSNPKAQQWFVDRLKKLQNETGLDSFKFDAGELLNYVTEDGNYLFHDNETQNSPNLFTTRYVETCARLGSLIEVRSAYRTQYLKIFTRMLDKDSHWGIDNGLKSLVTTALTMSLAGYNFILPDMIGGNGYGEKPDEQLFIRWLQANVFLPSMQFSYGPWIYSPKASLITKKMIDLHSKYTAKMIEESEKNGPLIRPLWFNFPDDQETYRISDQFMIGNDLLVAPVVNKNQQERLVYFPQGLWQDQFGVVHQGEQWINVKAPIEVLPYFQLKNASTY